MAKAPKKPGRWYSRSDGHRTAVGDWLVSKMPVLVRCSTHWRVSMMGARNNHSFVRRDIAWTGQHGFVVWSIMVALKPWGMSKRIMRVGPIYIGCA